jgi:hypothetical protein
MRVRGDVQPSNAFTLEEQPKKPGYYLVRFFENAQEFSEEKEGLTVSGWEYDEYHLELADTGSLEEDVLNNYDALLEQAKAAEAENEDGGSEGLEARVDALESGKADKDEVQAVWDEMAAAYNEGVQEA